VVIDTDGFRRVVDAMGGVKVRVTDALDDPSARLELALALRITD